MNTLKKLQFYMGKRKVLMPIALTLSGLSGLLSLMPFIFIWLIVRSLLLTGSVASGIPINVYAWWAVGTAVAGLVIYFAGLMLLHLAAFRVETNMRRTAMRKIMQMPLGFFDRNTSGQMRKIIDENASETHTFVAHLLYTSGTDYVQTGVAQLVEHRSPKPGVGSSSLSSRANIFEMKKIVAYFKETYDELVHKVSWPTYSELTNSAVVVLYASLLIAVVVFAMDFCFQHLMEFVYPH